MKFHRIYGMLLHYFYGFRHSYDKLVDAFYWPTLDLFLWGLTSTFVQTAGAGIPNFILIIVSGIVFWIIFWRAQYEITMGLLDELWNKNLVNIFVTPLRFSEWVTSWLIMGIIKGLVSFGFAAILAYLMYKTNIFVYGLPMIPFMVLLLLSGWWLGFFVASIIMRFGSKVQTLAWSMPWILAPFSAIYYPVDVLPQWAQLIAKILPTSYVFEGMRKVISTGQFDMSMFVIGLGLNLVYLSLALFAIHKSFQAIMQRGIIKLF